jgi:hypothetical protein
MLTLGAGALAARSRPPAVEVERRKCLARDSRDLLCKWARCGWCQGVASCDHRLKA